MTKDLTAEDILNAPDKVIKKKIESVDGFIYVRQLSAKTIHLMHIFLFGKSKKDDVGEIDLLEYNCKLIELSVVKADGKTPMFETGQVDKLCEKDFVYYNEIRAAVEEENPRGTKPELKKAKENLPQAQADALPTK